MEDQTFPYGDSFQLKIVALCLRMPKFAEQFADVLEPKYFSLASHRHLVIVLRDYALRYKHLPTVDTVRALIDKHVKSNHLNEASQYEMLSTLDSAISEDLADADWVKDEATTFARRQAVKAAIIESAGLLDSPDKYGEIEKKIRQALTVGNTKDPGINFRDVALDLPAMLKEGIFDSSRRVKTGLPKLDSMLAGGLGPGELGIVLAPPGSGKSMLMVSFGAAAIRQGFSVFHYTLELKAPMILERYAANLTGIPINEIRAGNPDYFDSVKQWLEVQQSVQVKYFSPYSVTPTGLRSHLSYAIAQSGVQPNLVIVDYPDLLDVGGSKNVSNAERSSALGRAYADLIGLGDDFGLAVWAPSQVSRDAWDDRVIGMSKAAFSAEKIHHADCVLGLCQTDEEMHQKKARLYASKVRMDEGTGQTINCLFDKSRSKMKPAADPIVFSEPVATHDGEEMLTFGDVIRG